MDLHGTSEGDAFVLTPAGFPDPAGLTRTAPLGTRQEWTAVATALGALAVTTAGVLGFAGTSVPLAGQNHLLAASSLGALSPGFSTAASRALRADAARDGASAAAIPATSPVLAGTELPAAAAAAPATLPAAATLHQVLAVTHPVAIRRVLPASPIVNTQAGLAKATPVAAKLPPVVPPPATSPATPGGSDPGTVTTPPGTAPPGGTSPGTTPPGTTPPGTTPPGTTPPSTTPGGTTPGTTSPGDVPPGGTPPGGTSPGTAPPGGSTPGDGTGPTTPPDTTPTAVGPGGSGTPAGSPTGTGDPGSAPTPTTGTTTT